MMRHLSVRWVLSDWEPNAPFDSAFSMLSFLQIPTATIIHAPLLPHHKKHKAGTPEPASTVFRPVHFAPKVGTASPKPDSPAPISAPAEPVLPSQIKYFETSAATSQPKSVKLPSGQNVINGFEPASHGPSQNAALPPRPVSHLFSKSQEVSAHLQVR